MLSYLHVDKLHSTLRLRVASSVFVVKRREKAARRLSIININYERNIFPSPLLIFHEYDFHFVVDATSGLLGDDSGGRVCVCVGVEQRFFRNLPLDYYSDFRSHHDPHLASILTWISPQEPCNVCLVLTLIMLRSVFRQMRNIVLGLMRYTERLQECLPRA